MPGKKYIEKKRFRLALFTSAIILLIMWIVHLANLSLSYEFHNLGIFPRKGEGLIGILASPLIHGDWQHLIANSMSFIVLVTGVFFFYPKIAYKVFFISWLSVGLIVWVIARPSYHIGASGVIYAMAAFLFLSGVIRKNFRLMAISLIIVFLYGSMVWGIFPQEDNVSWESHFAGVVSGFALAYVYRRQGPQKERYSWEIEEEEEESRLTEKDFDHTYPFGNIEIYYDPEKERFVKKENGKDTEENT